MEARPGTRQQEHHEAVMATLSEKIIGIKHESSMFRHKVCLCYSLNVLEFEWSSCLCFVFFLLC